MRRLLLLFLLAGCRVSVCLDPNGGPAYFCGFNGQKVNPAGMNYTQLANLTFVYPNTSYAGGAHGTLFTGLYDPVRVEAALQQMGDEGYTFIRVFISPEGEGWKRDTAGNNIAGPFYGIAGPWTTGAGHQGGLYRPYMDNFVDLLQRALNHGMYVQPTFESLPHNDYYDIPSSDQPRAPDGSALVEGVNLFYLAQPWIDKKKLYVQSFLQYVKDANPDLLPVIITVDLQNEIFMDTRAAPFNRQDVVTLADGIAYDMSLDVDRQQAVDANFVHWANELVGAADAVDPAALIGASVFTFNAIGLGGPNGVHSNPNFPSESRYPARPWSLATYSNLAYTDIHCYLAHSPIHTYDIAFDLGSSEFSGIPRDKKPLWLGEFGTFRGLYPSAMAAAGPIKQHKDALVALGFQAWGFWTWDISVGVGFSTFDAVEQGGAIDAKLNPLANGF